MLANLWSALPGPAELGTQLTLALWNLSHWLGADYRGLVLIVLAAGFALSWLGLTRGRH